MADERIRRQIALLAARLMYDRQESEYFTAKRKAARQLGVEYRYRPRDLPSNAEIRDQIQALANLLEGDKRKENLKDMRLAALSMMRRLLIVATMAIRRVCHLLTLATRHVSQKQPTTRILKTGLETTQTGR